MAPMQQTSAPQQTMTMTMMAPWLNAILVRRVEKANVLVWYVVVAKVGGYVGGLTVKGDKKKDKKNTMGRCLVFTSSKVWAA